MAHTTTYPGSFLKQQPHLQPTFSNFLNFHFFKMRPVLIYAPGTSLTCQSWLDTGGKQLLIFGHCMAHFRVKLGHIFYRGAAFFPFHLWKFGMPIRGTYVEECFRVQILERGTFHDAYCGLLFTL